MLVPIDMVLLLSHVSFVTVASQAPPSVGFPRQEYWSGLPFPSLGDIPDPRIEPVSPALAGRFFTSEPPGKPDLSVISLIPCTDVIIYNNFPIDGHFPCLNFGITEL